MEWEYFLQEEKKSVIRLSKQTLYTYDTKIREDLREASSFFAAQGPTKTIFASGWSFLMRRAVMTMGVRAMDM